jgi:GNAT superfamily N-acetyltransferase
MANRIEATLITGATRRDTAGCTVMLHKELPTNSWNFVVDVDVDAADFERSVKRVEAVFREARRSPAWITGPYDRPKDLDKRLAELGYTHESDRTIMYVHERPKIEKTAPEGLEIEMADEVTVDECIAIAVQRFGWPHQWAKSLRRAALAGMERGPDHYAMFHASLHGAGVATAFIVYSAATAGLYGMATSREFEGQGIGRAVLKHCANAAFHRGIETMTLQVATGSKAEKFYGRAGFKTAYVARRLVKGGGSRERAATAEEE